MALSGIDSKYIQQKNGSCYIYLKIFFFCLGIYREQAETGLVCSEGVLGMKMVAALLAEVIRHAAQFNS